MNQSRQLCAAVLEAIRMAGFEPQETVVADEHANQILLEKYTGKRSPYWGDYVTSYRLDVSLATVRTSPVKNVSIKSGVGLVTVTFVDSPIKPIQYSTEEYLGLYFEKLEDQAKRPDRVLATEYYLQNLKYGQVLDGEQVLLLDAVEKYKLHERQAAAYLLLVAETIKASPKLSTFLSEYESDVFEKLTQKQYKN